MKQNHLRDLYVKAINTPVSAIIKLEKVSGGYIEHKIDAIGSFGNIAYSPKSSDVDYRDIHFPSF